MADGVAVSFWIISIAMIAATVFFFAEASTVKDHWRTSLHVGGLVTLVAGVHYMYMREYWVQLHKSPVVYRYIDWTITVPLQMIEFNLILKAAKAPISSVDSGGSSSAPSSCLSSATLARPPQDSAGLDSSSASAAGPSSCSRSSLVSPPRHPATAALP